MAARSATVDILNKMAGKRDIRASGASKFAVRSSDLYFSPARQSSRLKQKVYHPQPPPALARNLEVPEEDDNNRSTPVRNYKRRKLNSRLNKASDPSPLKHLGYDVAILQPDKHINLDESPSQNTRSRRANPLAAMVIAIPGKRIENSQHSISRPQDNVKSVEVTRPEDEDEDEMQDDNHHGSDPDQGVNESEEESAAEEEVNANPEILQAEPSEENGNNEVGSDDQVGLGEGNQPPPSAQLSQRRQVGHSRPAEEGLMPDDESRPKNSKTARRKSSHGDDDDAQKTVGTSKGAKAKAKVTKAHRDTQKQKETEQANCELQKQAEEDEIAKLQQSFLDDLGRTAANLEGCLKHWAAIGGAALWLLNQYGNGSGRKRSPCGKTLLKSLKQLDRTYHDLRKGKSSVDEVEKRIKSEMLSIQQTYESIARGGQDPDNKKLGGELYRYIIPLTVFVVRSFFKARLRGNFLNNAALEELIRLLNLGLGFCSMATSWDPRPSTLDSGTLQKLRQDILPNLRFIEKTFRTRLDEFLRADRDRLAIDKLEQLQKAKLQAFEQQRKARIDQHRARFSKMVTVSRQAPVVDVDDIESDQDFSHDGHESPDHRQEQPRIQRQATEENMPAPLDDWSEIESIALLNGLQEFRNGEGYDRYEQILRSYDVLKHHDVDGLISQARYFKEVMTGSGVTPADWLSSVK